MPRDLGLGSPSSTTQDDNKRPVNTNTEDGHSNPTQPDDEEYVDVDHGDVEMHNSPEGEKRRSLDDLDLQRFGNNLEDVDEDEDLEDDRDDMAHHPLLSMLTGRLAPRRRGSVHKWDSLHPENQVLSVANVDECTKLEAEAFPENERCSREKFQYRLSVSPELSLGLFSQPTRAEAQKLASKPKRQLIAHIIATRTPSPSVTEASMKVPERWPSSKSSLPTPSKEGDEPFGHQNTGGTVCVHSLAVAKDYQKLGLGSVLMKSYIQRIKDAKTADRIALIAHDHLVKFYGAFGFENMGLSPVTFGNGGWNNMILDLSNEEEE